MLLITTSVDESKIESYLGIVTSRVALGANLFSDIAAGLRDVFGGRSVTVQVKLKEIEEMAFTELIKEAQKLKANAIIGISLDFEELSGGGKNGMYIVTAIGTAIKLINEDRTHRNHENEMLIDIQSSKKIISVVNDIKNNKTPNIDAFIVLIQYRTNDSFKYFIIYVTKLIREFKLSNIDTSKYFNKIFDTWVMHYQKGDAESIINLLFASSKENEVILLEKIKGLFEKIGFIELDQIIKLLDTGLKKHVQHAVLLLDNDINKYSIKDIPNFEYIQDKLRAVKHIPIEEKSGMFSSNRYWKCECGSENPETLFCTKCNRDRRGLFLGDSVWDRALIKIQENLISLKEAKSSFMLSK